MEIKKGPQGCLVQAVGLLFLLSAMFGFQRLAAALGAWDTLIQLGMQPGPLYAVFSGLAWGLVSLAAGLGLLTGQFWAPGFTRAAVVFLAAFYWIDRLALTRSEIAAVSEPFAAIATVLLAGITLLVVGRKR